MGKCKPILTSSQLNQTGCLYIIAEVLRIHRQVLALAVYGARERHLRHDLGRSSY